MNLKAILERIDLKRQEIGVSERQLSLGAGLSADGIRNWRRKAETSLNASVNFGSLVQVAEYLGVAIEWLAGEGGEVNRALVAVAGKVGAGARVPLFDGFEKGEGLYMVECPALLSPHGIVAVEVDGDSMSPMYQPGHVLFFSRVGVSSILDEDIGKPCVVEDAEGMAWVKLLKRGSGPGLFNLVSLNPSAESAWDREIRWAAKVRLALPAELVQKV